MKFLITMMTIPVIIATGCIGIGVRHAHDNGEHHHGHSHSHFHSHTHGKHSHSHKHDRKTVEIPHIHVAVFGIALTLQVPSDHECQRASSRAVENTSSDGLSGEFSVDLRPDVAADGLFQFLSFVESVVPEKLLASGDDASAVNFFGVQSHSGRCRDMPQTPPPEFV